MTRPVAAPAEQVAQGCRVLAANGHSDLVWGHLSLRDPTGAGIWMKAAGYGFEEVDADGVLLLDSAGTVLPFPQAGSRAAGRRHLEYPIHTQILSRRSDVNAVVHSHGEAAVTFAATGHPLRPLAHEGTLFSPPDVARFTTTGDLIRTPEQGAAVAEALGDRNALLLRHHGLVTVGVDVPTAVLTAVFLEKACRMQLAAMATGAEFTWSDDAEARAKRDRCYGPRQLADAWAYLVRTLPG
ncbi:class II aldolase/adducin family protein [Solwaraspora sp. WMMD937]|uniref:class II aldolase/adducin family protein n=1 Tax=Solwaraspora sp. WMMD937 TaxID=3016090 RepID=UPI00249C68E7|nr:class II aldolase/adducin family protein [Solwaraspora sp. WMMD937]WFE22545.1 class II aldolase/adducin family protein [Solwaraspora sp. WMMD937]